MGLNREEAAKLADEILRAPNKTATLKADITDWKTKIKQAEKQLKTAKGDKKAKLTADIANWKAQVAKAELQLKGAKADKKAKLTADIADWRSEEHTSELQSLMRISYAVFCLKKKKETQSKNNTTNKMTNT